MKKKLLAVLMVGSLVAAFMAGCQPKDDTAPISDPGKMDTSPKAGAPDLTRKTPLAPGAPAPGSPQTTPNQPAPAGSK